MTWTSPIAGVLTPAPIERVTLHLLRDDAPLAAAVLAERGIFDPETDYHESVLPEAPGEHYTELYRSARARLDKVLGHCAVSPTDLGPLTRLRPVTEAELRELDAWLGQIWNECSACQEALRRIEEEQRHVQQLLRTLDNFAALDIDLGLLGRAKRFLDVRIGIVPRTNLPRLREAVGLAGYVLQPFLYAQDQIQVVVAGPSGREDEIQALLQSAGWRGVEIPPELRADPTRVRAALRERAARIYEDNSAQCRLVDETQQTYHEHLVAAMQTLALAAPYAELGGALRGRGALIGMSGWVPTSDVAALRAQLDVRLAGRYVLEARPPRPDERPQVPSLMRHHRWLRPFVTLVQNYGVPRYGEIDPTLLFAGSFIVMFGMMFGDIAHGAVIVVAAGFLRRRLRAFTPFAVACGLSSMVFGWVYGSVFGFEEWVHPLLISPLSDASYMLRLALYWGIGFILFVTALMVYNRWVEGHYAQALFDGKGVAGMLFYVGVIYALYSGLHDHVFRIPQVLAILAPLLAVLGYKWYEYRGPVTERLLVVVIEGVETILNYTANTLSFLRVAAFSLNHVALSVAVFTLADAMHGAGHWITIVIGNVFILVMEGAIVGIQALRLEYYEGFSRFFSGAGRPFRPLSFPLATRTT